MQTASKKAFTVIELIFVIVVIGILAAVAMPRFAATRDDALITRGMATLASVRSAIATERQKRILRGDFTDISDLGHVERVTIEVAKEVMNQVDGAVTAFEPFIRYHTFDNSSINFTVVMRVHEFISNYMLKHEFIKALHKRYNAEGIVIPFPIRTVVMENRLGEEETAGDL